MFNWYASFLFCATAPTEAGSRHAHSAIPWMVARAASRGRGLGFLDVNKAAAEAAQKAAIRRQTNVRLEFA